MLHSCNDANEITFPSFGGDTDALVVMEGGKDLPFQIARVYTITGIPQGTTRGSHGHKAINQIIVCLSGGVEMEVDDGSSKRRVTLDDPRIGLHVPPTLWTDTTYITADTVLMVLCDAPYDEAEYIRDYDDFKAFRNG
ncbi:MAG: FdtA/QdtA family cupin domain-containing protein [Rhodospirillaceae bacterium]|jgi:dTDP-4-dehydrorhamnose 3,5-epimerase-like enzyme|nr:FdtA/QdtA family cupin domain-containing protein [Rhodospirillaceae bacterium]MBT4220486.1 FdtA/QdtA family cupin domain-containing protein [Rhodospirillaceae bacterium]MBT5014535.1 FdtA/QdtA family cupin domain-containing protein [Rhodospirillaceae bacterium]MBT5309506.1 FdtA/QdtA family cupin domain-containing protein [Rhodospirillaceae bacterium]MBT7356844.1 FdtA/QdtA family cupin domain-containing protein [Rhodospirillaceae bacterium]